MDKSYITEENVKIRYSEMDFNLALKPASLLQFMQDLASENAEKLGFGYSYITKNNLAWFLLKYHIEFNNYPENLYELKIKTEPRGYNKLFAFRDFEFMSKDKIIGRASSTWTIVDIKTKQMAPVSDFLADNPYMEKFEKKEGDLVYGKVKPIGAINKESEFETRYDDLDVNLHVNNVNYIVWAFEPLDFDFRKTHKLEMLDIVFKKEIKYGARVLSQIEIEENYTNHVVKNACTNEDLCLIRAKWGEK